MHLNYHFLKFLCPELREVFRGNQITACFSQNKDELIIETTSGENLNYIRAHFLPPQIYFDFPTNFKRAKRNSINLFQELIGDTIEDCEVYSFERAFYFTLKSGNSLVFKLHSNRSNVLLYTENEPFPIKTFRNEISEDHELERALLNRTLDLSFEHFEALDGNASKYLPTLGVLPRNWLKEQGYPDAKLDEKWAMMEEMIDMLDSPLFSIVEKSGETRLSLLPENHPIKTFTSPIQALNELFYFALVRGNFEKEKNTLLKKYQDQLKRHNSYIEKSSKKLLELKNSPPPSQLADVIMANLHAFQLDGKEVELVDFYTGNQIKVKLKPNEKPQDRAASLYRKSKNRKLEWEQLEKNISLKVNQVEQISAKIADLKSIDDFRALKAFMKSNTEDKSLQKNVETLPFKAFEYEGYAIWVGKSAQANDEMLRNFTKKDDLWLHARMVAGSHVLIKAAGTHTIPSFVIEVAASLAAFYSKNKTESLAPVIYTPAKYVRKVKGSHAGSVMVEKEKVLMVSPKSPEEIFGKNK